MSSILSQEEIDALLRGAANLNSENSDTKGKESLTSLERDALGELANISMGTAATTLSSLLGKKVEITTPRITLTTFENLMEEYPKPYVVVDVKYTHGLKGSNVLVIHTYDAGVIVDLMMGGEGSNPPLELNDLHISAISEAMNQMMGSSSTSLSQMLSKRIDISPPILDLVNLRDHASREGYENQLVKISFRMVIQGLVDSEMMQLIPISFAKGIVNELMSKNDMSNYEPVKKQPINQFTTSTSYAPPPEIYPQNNSAAFAATPAPAPLPPAQPKVSVTPMQFSSLKDNQAPMAPPTNLDLILDVNLQLSVELGRTHTKIKEILELSTGAIVELDKLAGEPVDILVNGKLLAKGEVVVIDENFGVRVTEIVSPLERVKSLQ